jgi:hypothetical protein
MDLAPQRVLLLMVAELHRLGYQRLRIVPGVAPSGLYWRCTFASAAHFSARHGARIAKDGPMARYSTGQARAYFDWPDAADDTPEQLARKFLERFPEIAAQSQGADAAYAEWYAEMLRLSEPDGAPIAYADWELDPNALEFAGEIARGSVPLPPGGEYTEPN